MTIFFLFKSLLKIKKIFWNITHKIFYSDERGDFVPCTQQTTQNPTVTSQSLNTEGK